METPQTLAPVFARSIDDAVAGLCGVWMVTGLFLDGWAHRNQKPETFFSPWHAVLYSGFIASAVWMLRVVRSHQHEGNSLRRSIPVGYGLRIIGVSVFGVGAIGDLIWHQIFGIEADIEALLSPTHLVLLTGGLLMAAGPIASTFRRTGDAQKPTWSSVGSVIAAVGFMLSVLQFFLMYLSPYDYGKYDYDYLEARGRSNWLGNEVLVDGIASALIFSILVGVAMNFLVKHVRVPRGGFAVIIFVPAILQSILNSFDTASRLIGPAVAALVAEATWPRVRNSLASPNRVAVVAGWISCLALITNYGMLIGVALSQKLTWAVHLWAGLPFLAALFAGVISVVVQLSSGLSSRPYDSNSTSQH